MKVTSMNDYFVSGGDLKAITCPLCRAKELTVVAVKRDGKPFIVQLRCVSDKCKKRIAYDVTNGFVTR